MTPLGPDRVMIEFRGLGLKKADVVLCPGGGFDVTPTDRIALMLKATLPRSDCPEAYELALGFETDHPTMSAGTAETLVEALGKSGKIGRGGRIVDLHIGRGCRDRGPKRAMPIPWGDVALAFPGSVSVHALALYFVHYNWMRIHKTLRVTPAMAAGLTTKLMGWEDIIAIMDDAKRMHSRGSAQLCSTNCLNQTETLPVSRWR